MKNQRVILFLKLSVGELHVSLPLLYCLKERMRSDIDVIFVSVSRDIMADMKVPKEYLSKIKEIGKLYFGKKELFELLKKSIFDKKATLIMTCDSGAGLYERLYYIFLSKSHIVHFHHAFALHGPLPASDQDIALLNYNKVYVHNSSIFLNSKNDRVWFESIGFDDKKIFHVGALGYSQYWLKKISSVKLHKANQEKLLIFVPLRDVHPLYLTKSNHDYLIDSLVVIFKKLSNYNFIVKFHPRQKNQQEINSKLANLHNVKQVSNLSTFQLAAKADLTLSFWSSAITDSLAVMTPAIEFHRHEVLHSQIIVQDGVLISMYSKMGFCEYFDNKDELLEFLEKQTKESLVEILNKQRECFKDVFGLDDNIYNRIEQAFSKNFKIAVKSKFFEIKRFEVLFKLFFLVLIGIMKKLNLKKLSMFKGSL